MDVEGIKGQDWTAHEIDLVVADYFDMLKRELRGDPYIKARHHEELQRLTGRSRRSIESKYHNISAVMQKLGAPYINGYKPLAHYQKALLDGIEKFIDGGQFSLSLEPVVQSIIAESPQVFLEDAPTCSHDSTIEKNSDLVRLIRKFDPAERDHRNRRLGQLGEERALQSERLRLQSAGRPDLARKVVWVSQDLGDGAGYDILSFDTNGQERFLEVKTTTGHRLTPFYISRNEKAFSDQNADRFRIYRLYDFARSARAFLVKPPLEKHTNLEVEVYKASFS